jgi:tetratricopeptide (TPR) repeat protein
MGCLVEANGNRPVIVSHLRDLGVSCHARRCQTGFGGMHPPGRLLCSLFLIGALSVLCACGKSLVTPAAEARPEALGSADVDAAMATCSNLGGETAPRLSACTAVIQSSTASAVDRSRALNNHGVLLLGQDNDRAIADFDAAIRINPQYAAAFYNRAQAWRRKSDTARADADAAQAVRLDPNLAGH